MQFSSYPGLVSSTDDFLQTSRGLVVTETTLQVASGDRAPAAPLTVLTPSKLCRTGVACALPVDLQHVVVRVRDAPWHCPVVPASVGVHDTRPQWPGVDRLFRVHQFRVRSSCSSMACSPIRPRVTSVCVFDSTYNNEWIVVDYNLFTPGHSLLANTVVIADQIPGMQWP